MKLIRFACVRFADDMAFLNNNNKAIQIIIEKLEESMQEYKCNEDKTW